MEITVAFKGMEVDQEIKTKILEKMNLLTEYLRPEAKIKITFWEYNKKKVSDGVIISGKNKYFAKSHSFDFEKTIDSLKNKLKIQILKSKNSISKGPRQGQKVRYEELNN